MFLCVFFVSGGVFLFVLVMFLLGFSSFYSCFCLRFEILVTFSLAIWFV